MNISQQEHDALTMLLDYTFHDESKDYIGCETEGRHTHIFNSIKLLAISSGYKDHTEIAKIEKEATEANG